MTRTRALFVRLVRPVRRLARPQAAQHAGAQSEALGLSRAWGAKSLGASGLLGLLGFVVGCPPNIDEPPVRAPVQFALPRAAFASFLDVPWPSDVLLKRDAQNNDSAKNIVGIRLNAFPNPSNATLLDDYLRLMQNTKGYSSSGGMYFRVPTQIDASTLPQSPRDSLQADASLFLVSLRDPSVRIPIEWQALGAATSFLPADAVSVLPLTGAVLHEPSALVLTSKAKDQSGTALGPSSDLRALLTCTPITDVPDSSVVPDCQRYQKLQQDLQNQLGLAVDDIALIQIIDPQDEQSDLLRVRDFILNTAPATPQNLRKTDSFDNYDVYEGTVAIQQFQQGEPPFDLFDQTTGGFAFTADGVPIVQFVEEVSFTVTVPKGEMPATGWPLAVNGHGTGGDLYSGLGNGARSEGHQLASAGFAMLSISEPLHSTRKGYRAGQEEVLTFNLFNPVAGRDNWRQSALEKVQLFSSAENLLIPANVTGSGADVFFNTSKLAYFGHSQGGIVGGILMGIENRILGAFLSGAGAGFGESIVNKTDPIVIADAMRTALSLPSDEKIDKFHPVLSLLQIWVDPADPLNWGGAWRHPTEFGAPAGSHVPHLVMTSGLQDTFTPKQNQIALAGAFGLPLVEPISESLDVLELAGITPASAKAQGNLLDDNGNPLTAGVLQYPNDGHFAVYNNPAAQEAYRIFFATLKDGVPVAQVNP